MVHPRRWLRWMTGSCVVQIVFTKRRKIASVRILLSLQRIFLAFFPRFVTKPKEISLLLAVWSHVLLNLYVTAPLFRRRTERRLRRTVSQNGGKLKSFPEKYSKIAFCSNRKIFAEVLLAMCRFEWESIEKVMGTLTLRSVLDCSGRTASKKAARDGKGWLLPYSLQRSHFIG